MAIPFSKSVTSVVVCHIILLYLRDLEVSFAGSPFQMLEGPRAHPTLFWNDRVAPQIVGPWASSISLAEELVRNVASRVPHQTYRIWICILAKTGDSEVH